MNARVRVPIAGLLLPLFSVLSVPPWFNPPLLAGEIRFERTVLDPDFPGAYQVEVADVNGDGKPDVVAVGGGTCAWYENPSWKKRLVSTPKETPGIISSATADLDGDGKAEVAIAYEFEMTKPKQGKLALASQGKSPDDPWSLRPIADVPSIHRLRWGDFDDDKRLDLFVAPIFGPNAEPPGYQDPARLVVFRCEGDPKTGTWTPQTIAERPVIHAIDVHRQGDFTAILTADNLGVAIFVPIRPADHSGSPKWISIPTAPGAEGEVPKRGASEIHPGKLTNGLAFFATIEPWHGNQVAISTRDPNDTKKPTRRSVIDDTLDAGHALWVADIDGDGDDEVFAGHRGKDHRVSLYDFDGKTWKRTVIDRDIAVQDLRGGDLDGDGRPDVVAVGGSTHNVVWYHPVKD